MTILRIVGGLLLGLFALTLAIGISAGLALLAVFLISLAVL